MGNVRPEERLQINQIQLVLLCNKIYCNKAGQKRVFAKLIHDLCELEHNCITIDNNNVKGTICCIADDNLGSNMIAGVTANFSSTKFTISL